MDYQKHCECRQAHRNAVVPGPENRRKARLPVSGLGFRLTLGTGLDLVPQRCGMQG